jgi:hypothetical protein
MDGGGGGERELTYFHHIQLSVVDLSFHILCPTIPGKLDKRGQKGNQYLPCL